MTLLAFFLGWMEKGAPTNPPGGCAHQTTCDFCGKMKYPAREYGYETGVTGESIELHTTWRVDEKPRILTFLWEIIWPQLSQSENLIEQKHTQCQ